MRELGVLILTAYLSFVFIPKRTWFSLVDGAVVALAIHLMMGWP
jgi:hypothetical protein